MPLAFLPRTMRGKSVPAITCPQCGAPTRVALAHPEWMSCANCTYRGAPPHEVSAALVHAARALFAVDARMRQLGWAQRRVGAGAKAQAQNVGCLFAGLTAPFVVVAAFTFWAASDGSAGDIGLGFVLLTPVLFMLVAGGLIANRMRKAARITETACSAVPAATPGAPLGCHVCGADLPAQTGASTTARCRYCSADNVVKNDVVAQQKIVATLNLVGEVQAQATSLTRHKRKAMWHILGFALLTPFSIMSALFAALIVSPVGEPTDRLVLLETKEGLCIAAPQGRDSYRVGGDSPMAELDYLPKGFKPAGTFTADALIGREVRSKERRGRVATVSRLILLAQEDLRLEPDPKHEGPAYRLWAYDLCLVGEADGLPVTQLESSPKPETSGAPPAESAKP